MLGMVACTANVSTSGGDKRLSITSKPAWSTQQATGVHGESLSQKQLQLIKYKIKILVEAWRYWHMPLNPEAKAVGSLILRPARSIQ